MESILSLHFGDIVELKKPHPCGNKFFKILRSGADIKLTCCQCGRTLTLERMKAEKMIKKLVANGDENEQ